MGFGHETWLSFTASAEEIATFLATSPVLQGIEPEVFDTKRMLLRHPTDYDIKKAEYDAQPHVFLRRLIPLPEWWNPELREAGRRYDNIPRERLGCYGTIIVNDHTGTVYICLGD